MLHTRPIAPSSSGSVSCRTWLARHVHPCPMQWHANAFLQHGLVRVQVGEAAGKVHVEPFVPKLGVQIETDPKATNVSNVTAMGDDEGVIEALIKRLQVWHPSHVF